MQPLQQLDDALDKPVGGWRLRAAVRGPAALLSALFDAGCSAAPSQDIMGSYFPSWLLCSVAGVLAAIVIRELLVAAGVNEFVPVPLLVYAALAAAFAMAVWLFWFG